MATIEQRLRALEAKRAVPKRNAVGQEWERKGKAMEACIKATMHALPNDEPGFIDTGSSRQFDYTGCLFREQKIKALAERIRDGAVTPGDQAVLECLPREALAVLEMSASDFILFTQETVESY